MSITYVRDGAGCYTRCPPGAPPSKAICKAPPRPSLSGGSGWIVGPPGPQGEPGPQGPPGDLAFVTTDATLTGDGTAADPLSMPRIDGGTY